MDAECALSTLPNGLRLLLIDATPLPIAIQQRLQCSENGEASNNNNDSAMRRRVQQLPVHVQLDVAAGQDDERGARNLEAAHLLEHLMATFASRRHPDGLRNEMALEQRGVASNASVGEQRSTYWLRGPAAHLDFMLELLLSAYAEFALERERFERERSAVQRELAANASRTWLAFDERVASVTHPSSGHPRAVPEHARLDNVAQLSARRVRAFRRRFYGTENALLTVAGPLSALGEQRVASAVRKRVATWPRRAPPPLEPCLPRLPLPHAPALRVHFVHVPAADTSRLALLFPLDMIEFDRERYALRCLENILASGFSSRLLSELRVRRGLVYSVSARGTLDYRHAALSSFCIGTSAQQSDVLEVVRCTLDILAALCRDGPTRDEMRKWRARIRALFAANALDGTPERFVSEYAAHALFGHRVESNVRRRTRALRVSAADVRQLARRVFARQTLSIVHGAPEPDSIEPADWDSVFERLPAAATCVV